VTRKVPRRSPARRRRGRPVAGEAPASRVKTATKAELDSLRAALAGAGSRGPARWNADPDDVQRSVARLVLALVEFLRKLMEKQAIRRMEAGTLTEEEVENVGLALMRLEETLRDIAGRFGLTPDELNLDLGPLGKLI